MFLTCQTPCLGKRRDGTDHLGDLPPVLNTTGLYRQHCSFAQTAAASHYRLFFKEDTNAPFSQRFTYPAILAVYPDVKRTAPLLKLSIFFHSTLTCLSYLGRKAVKKHFFFWFIWICLFRALSSKSKGKSRQISKQTGKGPYCDLTAFRVH